MSVNVLTLNELTNSKLNSIADNIMLGPQASIMESLNNINGTHQLDLGVTKTFRWSPGVYDKIKKKIYQYNGFEMSNSGMYHLFRRMDENYHWYKKCLKDKVVGLENELKNLRDSNIVWQDNSDATLNIYALIKEKIEETYNDLNDDIQIRYNILEQVDDDTNEILYNNYKIRFLIEYNNIDVHIWTGRSKRYLGAVPTGPVTLNIQMNLVQALNNLSVRQNNMFKIVNLPSNYSTEGSVFNIRGLYDSDVELFHPFIGTNTRRYGRDVILCNETKSMNWRNVCTGDMGKQMALKCINFDLNEINGTFKQWLSNFIVNHTHPLNGFRTWFHGLPKWLKETEDLHAIIGHREDVEDCYNATQIIDKESDGDDFTSNINYCTESECQLQANCNTFKRLADPDYIDMRNQLIAELSLILGAVPYDVDRNWRFTTVENLIQIISKEDPYRRQRVLEEAMDLYSKVYPKTIFADLNSFVEQRNLSLWLTRTLINYVHDLRKEYELVQEGCKSGKYEPETMSEEEMVRVLQTRNNNMGLIATHPQTSADWIAPVNTSTGNIHGGEQPQGDREQEIDWSDEEWEEFERQEAEEIAEYERHLREIAENPEPTNLEEE
jgi:hypothetical protein